MKQVEVLTHTSGNSFQARSDIGLSWYAAGICMMVITFVSILGNIVVMMALRRAPRIPAHYPLASLAAADFLVGICVLPIAAIREQFILTLNWAICAWWSTMDVLCCTASILSLCIVGYERWWGITAPLARARRARRAKLLAILVWPASIAVAVPTAFIPSTPNDAESSKACTVNNNVGYVFFSVSLSFYLPTSVMVFFYARILQSVASMPAIRYHRGTDPTPRPKESGSNVTKSPSKCVSAPTAVCGENVEILQKCAISPKCSSTVGAPGEVIETNSNMPQKQSNSTDGLGGMASRQRRATIIIVRLMSLFLFCWTPFFVMLPIDSLCGCVSDTVWRWCTWLGYANSAFDPLVYAVASPSVRRALIKHHTIGSSDTPITICTSIRYHNK